MLSDLAAPMPIAMGVQPIIDQILTNPVFKVCLLVILVQMQIRMQ